MTRQPAFRTHDHKAQLELLEARATEKYSAACRLVRFGSTPAIREAARAEALRLRPIVHPGL